MDAHPERPQALFVRLMITPTIAPDTAAAQQLAGMGADIDASARRPVGAAPARQSPGFPTASG
jgi:hypothetical protein